MNDVKISCTVTKVISVLLMLVPAGCAVFGQQNAVEMEKLLTASGFEMRLADTADKLAQLKELPQRKLIAKDWGGKVRYVYVDASNCKCAYVGDEEAYEQFQELARKKQIAEEDRRAAERDQTTDTDVGGWRFNQSW